MIRRIGLAGSFMAGVLAAAPASAGQVLVAEPVLTLQQNFLVAANNGPPAGQFMVVQWQVNPLTTSHLDVPLTAPISRLTGFAPPPPLSQTQAGVANRVSATGAQIYGKTIGISLNSLDFSPTGTVDNLVGIFPNYVFPANVVIQPFAQPGKTLMFTIQAQVPTAAVNPPANNPNYNGSAYFSMDIVIADTAHPSTPQITLIGQSFAYGYSLPPPESIGYDPTVNKIFVNTHLSPGLQFSTLPPISQRFQGQTWMGFRTFQFAMTQTNLANAITAIQGSTALLTSLGLTAADISSSPAAYALVQFHVNSELNYAGSTTGTYSGGSVQMGLAIRNMELSLQDASDCTTPHNGVDGTLGLENGDDSFLCVATAWYECGGTSRAWATTAATGQTVGPYQCNGKAWVPAQ